jgi:hypothetical protein
MIDILVPLIVIVITALILSVAFVSSEFIGRKTN